MHALYVFVRFRRKSYHEIQFYRAGTTLERNTAGVHYFFFRYILVDNVAQPLCSRFGSECKPALRTDCIFSSRSFL